MPLAPPLVRVVIPAGTAAVEKPLSPLHPLPPGPVVGSARTEMLATVSASTPLNVYGESPHVGIAEEDDGAAAPSTLRRRYRRRLRPHR